MTLLKPLLSLFSLVATLHFASGIEYTSNGVAIVGTTEPLDVNVTAGTSREDLISYQFASYIAVHFADFNLPDGDSVVISSPDANATVSHTYTGRGRDQSGTFIASFIPGNSVTVTYKSVGAATAGQGYRITGYSRGYPTMDQESICGDGDQSLPAKCYAPGTNLSEGLPQAYKKAQAVARLLINGTYLCTGWLGGSEGHLFTNHHCFEQEDWALTTDFEFAAESSSCSDQCETQLGCAGTIVATTSTFIADDEDIDYSVVKLPDCVDLSAYGYLQLRESGPVVNESIYVPQHPDGYAKRIVSTVDGGADTTILSVGVDGSCGTEQVGHDADTQGGSSGSPLISTSDNLVVAIHHCGGCANAAIDVRTVLTDLASKNITIENLVASDDAGQSELPSYAQTPCTAQTHTKHGVSKSGLTTTASNRTRSVATRNNSSSSSPSPVGTVTASTDSPSAASAKTTSTSTVSTSNSTSTNTTSATTTTTSKSDTKGSTSLSVSSLKTALTSASVVTSTKATKTSSAPSGTTSSSSSSTTTSTSNSTVSSSTSTTTSKMAGCDSMSGSASSEDTVDNNTIVAKLKAAVVGSSTPTSAAKTGITTPTPTSTRATAAPPSSPVTPSPTLTSTPKPSTPRPTPASTTVAAPRPTPASTASSTPKPTPAATATLTSATPRPRATPAATTTSTPKPTPSSTSVASSGGSGWGDVEQN